MTAYGVSNGVVPAGPGKSHAYGAVVKPATPASTAAGGTAAASGVSTAQGNGNAYGQSKTHGKN